MRDLPHLTYLQAFEASARHLSFTRVSEELNCTQAAISQRIRGLEQYFGRPLFHRKPNGLELSSAGAAYLPGITQALDVMDAATRGLTGRRVKQTVTVSAPISFLNRCLAPLLPEFTAAHPEIGLRLNSSIWTDPNLDLADLNIGFGEAKLLPDNAIRLAPAPVVRVAVAGSRKPAQRRLEVQGKFPLWELWSEAAGETFEAEFPPCRVDTADTALHLAVQGLGHAVVYEAYALAAAGQVAGSLPVDIGHVLLLQLNPARQTHSATRVFVDWLSTRFLSEQS
ncbi:LysR family transcriptional regulator [Paracoccus saliphilus]|uniref:LysR family transcriptional regulator n=1 Tax=Paracoccus saliphilus TaxID=405559 RepID=A0AA45W536_9RHOB|nr:LysR family transcriptional regulator [Paracoccus saliphilus]WCR02119.1 LysR family transcriptional regulator [Paracoccus saliphilus]SIS90214.1 transcriptional regulator, LysR family [Paracoccus saliphilus]